MIIVSYKLNTEFGLDNNVDDRVERFMNMRGFNEIGAGSGYGRRDLEYCTLSEDDESDDLTVCRTNSMQKAWVDNGENLDGVREAAGVPVKIRFEPAHPFDAEAGDFVQCSEPFEEIEVERP